jgi:hypothetical protein
MSIAMRSRRRGGRDSAVVSPRHFRKSAIETSAPVAAFAAITDPASVRRP